jgi:hypothetical protein
MVITSKYAGVCGCGCGGRIEAGSRIDWERGRKARLLSCATRSAEPSVAAPATPQRAAQPARRTHCSSCGVSLSGWDRTHGMRMCQSCRADRRDGGSRHKGGASYRDAQGNFVLGDDD